MAPPQEGPETTIIDEANVEFRWGLKRNKGVKGKDIQFYDSFTYDGVEYSSYDCVYVHKEGEPEPYIGRIMKIWDDLKLKKKRIKVWWFFRPIEIRNFYEGDCSPANKELFLASGEAKGVFNVNLLEVIVGKCKVLCTSADPRNPQPSEEDLNSADYFFNRTFNCDERMVSEGFEGVEAEAFINKQAWVSKSVQLLGQRTNGANENQANKSMANGSLSLKKEGAKLGISEELTKSKVDTCAKEGEAKKYKTSETKVENHEIHKEMNISVTVKGEVKGNESPKEGLKAIETVKEEMEGNNEELKSGGITKEETKKSKSVKQEMEINENSNDELKKLETANKGLTKGKIEIPSKGIGKVDSPKQSPHSEVRISEKKGNKSEPLKDGKKPLKRARPIVHSDDEADDMAGFKVDGSENLNRNKTDSKKEVVDSDNRVVKKAKLSDSINKTSEEVAKTSHPKELIKEKRLGREIIEITRRPEVESNKWFKALAWDERLKKGYEQRAVIRVQNFDPSYTSAEIDDIMWHMVGERCTTQVMPQTMFSNPNSGDALVVFRTKEGAEMALKKLSQACLNFSDGRSLLATRASPVMSGKQKFAGHISVEKHKLLMQRGHHSSDMKKAVSTSHCSQPNTIEYEMAMEWRLLQEKSERWWNELYKQEASEVNDVKRKNMVPKKGN